MWTVSVSNVDSFCEFNQTIKQEMTHKWQNLIENPRKKGKIKGIEIRTAK